MAQEDKKEAVVEIRKSPATVFLERAFCSCGGEMQSDGMVLLTFPQQYPHVCNRCGAIKTMCVRYPALRHEDGECPETAKELDCDWQKEHIRAMNELQAEWLCGRAIYTKQREANDVGIISSQISALVMWLIKKGIIGGNR